jgi:3'-5' exonuclease
MKHIYFDIETIPAQRDTHVAAIRAEMDADRATALQLVKAPSNYKDPEKIAAYIEAERERINADHEAFVQAAILKTGLDGSFGQIVCIGWAFDDGETQSLQAGGLSLDDEASLIADWFAALSAAHVGNSGTRPVLVGHNHAAFDIPFVWKRAIVHGIKPPFWFPRDPKPWSDVLFDTMTQWAGARERISLDRLCRALGITGKDDFTGADVWPAVQAGRINDVASYCRGDVERTRAIHRRMSFAA